MMNRILLTFLLLALSLSQAMAFCGFYVAKADKRLFNKTSEVIIVRDGNKTTVTMSNDFQGDVKDFAMVIPVPEVLKRNQVSIGEASLFNTLDTYSAPRLVYYNDPHPCPRPTTTTSITYNMVSAADIQMIPGRSRSRKKKYQVQVKARYKVEEYEIVILSAKNSTGLEAWLKDKGYKIPDNAAEVLRPYIRSGMKFFVVKVDAQKIPAGSYQKLRPLKIAYNSDKFMLPIRLGMANATEAQDMMVYFLSKKGRVETVNYPTMKIPTDTDIPEFVSQRFGEFYKDLFVKNWAKNGRNDVFLEYSWDLSSQVTVKCDPCNGPPPQYLAFQKAGVDWLNLLPNNQGYSGNIFFTRLHVRYDREHFPQDLMFKETPNKERFQGRYVIHRSVSGPYNCSEGNRYIAKVRHRRKKEMENMTSLTDWDLSQYSAYVNEYDAYLNPDEPTIIIDEEKEEEKEGLPLSGPGPRMPWIMLCGVILALCLSLLFRLRMTPQKK